MWIRGLKTLHKPLLHLHTQFGVELPWHSIDMDFMNLNQAAHGDREFGYIQSRLSTSRKTIAGHVSDPHTRGRIGSWVRAALGHAELSTLKVARFGDNMRGVAVTEGDKVEAEAHFGASIDTYGVNDLVEVVERVRPADVDKLVREYEHTYGWPPSCSPAATGTRRCGTARRSNWACGSSCRTAGSTRSPRTSRTSAGCVSCPGWPCSG